MLEIIKLNPVSWGFLLAAAFVWLLNTGKRSPRDAAAPVLAFLMVLFQLGSIFAFANVPRPWSYGPDAPLDMVLLFVALGGTGMRMGKRGLPQWDSPPPRWIAAFSGAVLCGLLLQAWFWWMMRDQIDQAYDVSQYRLYLTHARIGSVLSAVELVCVASPGIYHWAGIVRRVLRHREPVSGLGSMGG